MISFNLTSRDNIQILEFTLERPITPETLKNLSLPKVNAKPLVLSGRGPVWLYAFLVHHYCHLVPAIATYDPKVGGGVVVASHHPDYQEGDVIPL